MTLGGQSNEFDVIRIEYQVVLISSLRALWYVEVL